MARHYHLISDDPLDDVLHDLAQCNSLFAAGLLEFLVSVDKAVEDRSPVISQRLQFGMSGKVQGLCCKVITVLGTPEALVTFSSREVVSRC